MSGRREKRKIHFGPQKVYEMTNEEKINIEDKAADYAIAVCLCNIVVALLYFHKMIFKFIASVISEITGFKEMEAWEVIFEICVSLLIVIIVGAVLFFIFSLICGVIQIIIYPYLADKKEYGGTKNAILRYLLRVLKLVFIIGCVIGVVWLVAMYIKRKIGFENFAYLILTIVAIIGFIAGYIWLDNHEVVEYDAAGFEVDRYSATTTLFAIIATIILCYMFAN